MLVTLAQLVPASSNGVLELPIEPDIDLDGSLTSPLVQAQRRYETTPVWKDEDVFEEE